MTSSHQIHIVADKRIEDLDFDEYDMLVLPGGMPGTNYLAAHDGLRELLTEAEADGKKVAAICAAPMVLGGIGILPGAVVGGLILGVVEALVSGFISSTFRDAAAFAILILVLLVRPAGIFGKDTKEKV